MNEFFRGPAWASAEAQNEWEPRLRVAAGAWGHIESLTVSEGLRDSALFTVTPAELVAMTQAANGKGLEATPLGETFVGDSYSAGQPSAGAPGLRVALHRAGLRGAWLEAWRSSDDVAIGALLGFPECCIRFFRRVWAEERKRDTTLSMAPGVPGLGCILLRWLGVRLVGHLPCGHECEATEKQARAHAELGRRHGLAEGVDALEQLLGLPMEYTALHGAGVVATPLFRFMFSTDYTARKETFAKPGAVPDPDPPSCRDNGFSTLGGMEAAHATIDHVVPIGAQSILDLGCGDGSLLARLRLSRPTVVCMGVDFDAGRVVRGRRRHPGLLLDVGRIESVVPADVDVALLMPGRLLEMSEENASDLRNWLQSPRVRHLVVYAYGDHLPLQALLERTGVRVRGGLGLLEPPIHAGAGVEVAVLQPEGRT